MKTLTLPFDKKSAFCTEGRSTEWLHTGSSKWKMPPSYWKLWFFPNFKNPPGNSSNVTILVMVKRKVTRIHVKLESWPPRIGDLPKLKLAARFWFWRIVQKAGIRLCFFLGKKNQDFFGSFFGKISTQKMVETKRSQLEVIFFVLARGGFNACAFFHESRHPSVICYDNFERWLTDCKMPPFLFWKSEKAISDMKIHLYWLILVVYCFFFETPLT